MSTRDQIFSCLSAPVVSPPEALLNPPARILLVDDDSSVRDTLRTVFAGGRGCVVAAEASSAEEAFAELRNVAVDLVLLRADLPGMSGLQATRAIMHRQPTPIVIMADPAASDPSLAFECLRSGALDTVCRNRADLLSSDMLSRLTGLVGEVRHARSRKPLEPQFPSSASLRSMKLLVLAAGKGALGPVMRLLDSVDLRADLPIVLAVDVEPDQFGDFVRWLDEMLEPTVRTADSSSAASLTPGAITVVNAASMSRLVGGEDGIPRLSGLPRLPGRKDRVTAFGNPFDLLFLSAADATPQATTAVLFGHPGRDGAVGLHALGQAGGQTLLEQPPFCPFAESANAVLRMGTVTAFGTASMLAELISTASHSGVP